METIELVSQILLSERASMAYLEAQGKIAIAEGGSVTIQHLWQGSNWFAKYVIRKPVRDKQRVEEPEPEPEPSPLPEVHVKSSNYVTMTYQNYPGQFKGVAKFNVGGEVFTQFSVSEIEAEELLRAMNKAYDIGVSKAPTPVQAPAKKYFSIF